MHACCIRRAMAREELVAQLALLGLLWVQVTAMHYNTNATIAPGKLNVHLVPHTHDDVGWLRTVDEYYEEKVKTIITSVVNSLKENPDRKFVIVEQAFFQKWWNEQKDAVKGLVKQLVNSGQLDFINGGWCMHDEATTHYVDMIEQTTLGHAYLKDEFGKIPRIGWQIDPFGHSAVQGYLLGAELGFDGLFLVRIDYQNKEQRKANKSLEFIWQGSKTFKSDAQIFTDVFSVHYNPPEGFEYESIDQILLQDDSSKGTVNVAERVEAFVIAANNYAEVTRTNHVMWAMGDDFKYVDAEIWFTQMDKLIHYVNKDGRVNALYSTPSIYLKAKHAADQVWALKTNDFFPYAEKETSYWTGYFTSRPALKGYVRMLSSYFQAARQLEFLVGRKNRGPQTYNLWAALSVVQHHDGVSGTEKQHVADDYAKQLAAGATEAEEVMNSAVTCLASGSSSSDCRTKNMLPNFVQCPLLNVSYCPASEATISAGKPLLVTAYNSLGWAREEYIRIPVSSTALIVIDATGKAVPSQLTPISAATSNLRNHYVQANLGKVPGKGPIYWLVFKAEVPPLGFSSYSVRPSKPNEPGSAVASTISVVKPGGSPTVEVGFDTKVSFSTASGQPVQITSKESGEIKLQQSYNWYAGYAEGDQDSGAYVFRPAGETAKQVSSTAPLTTIKGPVYEAAQRQISPWISQEFRLYKDKEHAEVEFTVGPIPVDDGIGKEVITKFTTGIQSNKKFYTDSNGRDFIERVRDSRPDFKYQVVQPVAANYYPVNLGIYLGDSKTDLSVLVDRSMGGASLADGEVELMLHRRLLVDDGKGVGEALNEEVCVGAKCKGLTVRGLLYLSVNPVGKAARWRREQGQKAYAPLQLFFSTQDENKKTLSFSAVNSGYALPDNVALITFQELKDGSVLLRLAHIFEVDEDEQLSKPAQVDLKQLLWGWEIQKVDELSLSANQPKSNMKPLQWKVAGNPGPGAQRGGPVDANLVVTLGPMEIRTLQLSLKPKA